VEFLRGSVALADKGDGVVAAILLEQAARKMIPNESTSKELIPNLVITPE
jgi:hypothetical protein